ncbi:ABC transporter ATP-binding protein [Actinopolymorpha alba]|uniref:ABC transporter ATP-binding protein n=1 Tax=Actinopolymorpha alba TaxID=533267 RepID=UPI00035EF98C|nr:ABC transporter ATP-binding protein [Actinopolymorpha alba]
MRERWRELALLVRTAVRTDPWRSLGTLLEPLGSLMYPLFGWLLGFLADALLARDGARLVAGAAGLLAAITLQYVAAYVGTSMRLGLSERAGFAFDREIARLTSEVPGLEHHERADYQDRLELLRQSQGVLGQSLNHLVTTANALVGAIGTAVVLLLLHPLVLLLVLFALPALPIAALQQRWQASAERASAAPSRLARHLRGLTVDRAAGMELRVFGLQDEVLARMRTTWWSARRPLHRSEVKASLISSVRSVIFAVGFALAVGFVLARATRGQASPGDVITAVAVCQQVRQQVLGPAYNVAGLGRVLRAAGRLLWLQDYAAEAGLRPGARGLPAPARLSRGIELDRVSFRYPGTPTWGLREVSLRIPPGGVVAVVGENGAGKTTLVKLLCRLYEPTSGRILVDEVDLAEIDVESWRARLSAAFQDFARLELRAVQTVGVGDLAHVDDRTAVNDALRRAGAEDVFARLPAGGDTQLGSGWEGGVDLSTGQWQKLALGRALMRPEPLLTFFDEPTASLDAPTEHALFERYAAAGRAGATSGGITILVTHRFSTVRSADLILVLGGGELVEYGTHDQLMADAGLYAELYRLQADSYA